MPSFIHINKDEFLTACAEPIGIVEIASRFGVSRDKVMSEIKRLGISRDSRVVGGAYATRDSAWKSNNKLTPERIRSMYWDKGMSANQIAESLGISRYTLYSAAHRLGLSLPEKEKTKRFVERNIARWDAAGSTRSRMSRGYKLKKVKHPNSDGGGYMREHRLVAENAIGRLLEISEQVHHLNFDKSDNRIQNLAIMDKSDHMKFHHYMEKIGAYGCGLIGNKPEPIQFKKPAWIDGAWVNSFDAFAAKVAKAI